MCGNCIEMSIFVSSRARSSRPRANPSEWVGSGKMKDEDDRGVVYNTSSMFFSSDKLIR